MRSKLICGVSPQPITRPGSGFSELAAKAKPSAHLSGHASMGAASLAQDQSESPIVIALAPARTCHGTENFTHGSRLQ